jgi:hypothetical protein
MGHMLGSSCSFCCSECPCFEGSLPESLSVSLSGPSGTKAPGPSLLALRFTSCFGSGAAGFATAPGGVPEEDIGPISAATLTNVGGGYAKLGRVAPALTITGSGEGATFTPTLQSTNDNCGVPTWKITAVSVSGGAGYFDSEQLSVTASAGDVTVAAANLTLSTKRSQPEVTATVSGGTGADLLVTLSTSNSQEWTVGSVSVQDGGSGYSDYAEVVFQAAAGDTVNAPATAYARTNREEPTVSASVEGTGSGAILEVTLTKYSFDDLWYVSAISVTNGGSGYTDGDFVVGTTSDQAEWFLYAEASVTDGVVTGVTIYDGGAYYRDGGVIQSIELLDGGEYYRESPDSVVVNNGGKYFREDATQPPYVSTVSVSVLQGWPGRLGVGAVIAAAVNSDTSSADFGKLSSLSVTNGGSGYLGFRWVYSCDCNWVYGSSEPINHTVVAYRLPPIQEPYTTRPCTYMGGRCDDWPCIPPDPPEEPPPPPPPPPPVLGACYVRGSQFGGAGGVSCSLRTLQECIALGGSWAGPGTQCPPPPPPPEPGPTPPPDPVGACTYISRSQFGGAPIEQIVCAQKTETECFLLQGTFAGPNTQCQ